MISLPARKTLATFLANAFSLALIIAILFRSIAASTTTDGSTPLALTPGAPAGIYPLSGLDSINVYNGNLNFHLPLVGVGGRGNAGYTITLPIEQHWRVNHTILSDGRELNIPVYNPWTPIDPGYGPGALYGRQVSDGSCSQSLPNASTLTRLTFVTPDGTEHELIDKLTGGGVRTSFCSAGLGFARGTVFVSTNGAMTFVSDSTIHDHQFGAVSFYPTGYLMLPDGTRLRIVNGRVESLRDRNGNQVTMPPPTSNRVIATDPLGREIIVDKNFSDVAPYGLCDKITFNGVGGVQRFIRVSKTNLGSALRMGYSPQTPAALFPQLDGSSATNHDPQVISAVWLPDGIRSYDDHNNENIQVVWLRLHNNTRWAINFPTDSLYVGPKITPIRLCDGRGALGLRTDIEVNARYEAEAVSGYESARTSDAAKPPVINRSDVFSTSWLPPGGSVIFSVPREHLAERLAIYIPYNYEWEYGERIFRSDEPQHRVYFRASDLPEKVQTKTK